MEEFFSSGHAIDVVLAVLVGEAAWLKYRRWPSLSILTTLGPAVLMMLGTRAALVGASWIWIALPLAASFPLHLADLGRQATKSRDQS